MDIPLAADPDDIRDFWARSVERVNHYRPAVHFSGFDEDQSSWDIFKELDLSQLTLAERIVYRVNTPSAARRLIREAETFSLPIGGTSKLTIGLSSTVYHSLFKTDPSTLVHRYHSFGILRQLNLDAFDFTNIHFRTTFGTVKEFRICDSVNLQVDILAKAFPNVVDSIFKNNTYHFKHFDSSNSGTDTPNVVQAMWPEMKTIFVGMDDLQSRKTSFPWGCLEVPQIKGIHLPNLYYSELTPDFIGEHPSLHYLDIVEGAYGNKHRIEYSNLAAVSSHLRELAIIADDTLLSMTPLDLPKLKNLILYDPRLWKVTLDIFDHIVGQRFLPPFGVEEGVTTETNRREKDKQASRTRAALTILTLEKFNPQQPPPWYKSNLMKDLKEMQYTSTRWDKTYMCFRYTWSKKENRTIE
jgi:hypothetical protein